MAMSFLHVHIAGTCAIGVNQYGQCDIETQRDIANRLASVERLNMLENLCKSCFASKGKSSNCPICGYSGKKEEDKSILTKGTILNGKYVIGKLTARGGFVITYLSYDLSLDLKVSIKEYFSDALSTRSLDSSKVLSYSGIAKKNFEYDRDKFINEAKILEKFNSISSIATVNDFFLENNTAYLVMDCLEGVTLSQFLKKMGGKIPWSETQKIFLPIMKTLEKIHKTGIILSDIVPHNIFLTNEGVTKLLGFGAVRFAASEKSRSLAVIYNQGYAPPEQYLSKGEQGPWTDVYGICASIYKSITGVTPTESINRIVFDDLLPPSALGCDMQKEIEQVLMKGFSTNYKNRYDDLGSLLDAFVFAENNKRENCIRGHC